MLSKTILLAVASFLGATTANPYADKCNPANCPLLSTQCYKCDVRADPTCILGEAVGLGFCIEPVPLSQKKSYGQKYHERCRRATDPNGGNALPAEAYVKACREFEYTCMDGTCEAVKGLPKVCKKNLIEPGSGKCDPDLPDLAADIPSLWDTAYKGESLKKVCEDHGGVKYDYLRCDSPFLFQGQSTCDENSPFKVDITGCESNPPTINKDTLECTETEVVAESEACCLVDEEPGTCRPLIQVGPSYPESEVPSNGGSEDLPASGIVFELEIEDSTERCCCKQSCSCFGDPHCDSLFGNYEISRGEGSFTMFEEKNFKLDTEIGAPGGVILEAIITMNGETRTINSDECMESDKFPLFDPLPIGWKFRAGDGMEANPVYHISDTESHTVAVVTCILFEQTIGDNKGIHTRLDVDILKNVPLEAGVDSTLCCPSPEVVFDVLHPGTAGFCSTDAQNQVPVLPDSRRRLDTDLGSPEIPDFTNPNAFTKLDDKKKAEILTNADKTCRKIQEAIQGLSEEAIQGLGVCKHFQECKIVNVDFGEACSELNVKKVVALQSMEWVGDESPAKRSARINTCHSFASDEAFDPDKQEKCARGVKMQAKKQNSNNWETLYFFPDNIQFCDGKINILFEHALVDGEPLDLNKHDVQFVTCSATDECSFECFPEVKISSMKARFMYPCKTSLAKDEFIQHAFSACDSCDDFKDCVATCVETGECGCDI